MEQEAAQAKEFIDIILTSIMNHGPDLFAALVILVVGGFIAKGLRNLVGRGLNKIPNMDATLKPLLSNLSHHFVMIVTIIAVLSQFGVETTSIIAVLGAAGLAIGLALQGTLQNIAAGIMLLMLRPFKVDDFIDAGGISGTVKVIRLFMTDMMTADGLCIVVPNSSLWNSSIINYSRNTTRRISQVMGISYGDDVAKARGVLLEMMEKDERVLADPAPQTMVTELAGSSVNITLRCWVNSSDYWLTHCDFLESSKEKIEGAGLSIPYPQQDVHMYSVVK